MMSDESVGMKVIARIYTDFPDKFGVPRQSGLADGLAGRIVFEKEYRVNEAFRELEAYTHLWIIWHFSRFDKGGTWSATVRPPRLGGNRRVGVFATRSPNRPNPIGLSCVRLERIDYDDREGPVLIVRGADMVSGTPIFDIKPYLPYVDCRADAKGGFSDEVKDYSLEVADECGFLEKIPAGKREGLVSALEQDPRPAYHDDPDRIYGFPFAGFEVKFRVCENTAIIVSIVSTEDMEDKENRHEDKDKTARL